MPKTLKISLFQIGLNLGSAGTHPYDTPVRALILPNDTAMWSAPISRSRPC
ncbi:hypothetical protein F383_35504 [Gossypium arboreum]|uniref:Uncharacterized protein n=1 Tax=Gossypium arboreum TaxID=29729 RepID=A0A0B0PWE3_GOSAR|nr:hypothetical protein F383_35504 [Gossypium arboreum]